MGFFDLFKSREEKAKLTHLKNLLALAAADGVVQKEELAAIAVVMAREGMTTSDLERCMKHPDSIKFVQPTSDYDKLRYIKDMVSLMMVDGDLDENEMMVCMLTAEAFGYRHEVVGKMIKDIINEI